MDFYERTKKLCKEQNITIETLMLKCNLSRETFSKWGARRSYPRSDNLCDMSRVLGVSMDYLFTGRNSDSAYSEYLPYLEKASDGDLSAIRKILGMPEKILNSGKIIV